MFALRYATAILFTLNLKYGVNLDVSRMSKKNKQKEDKSVPVPQRDKIEGFLTIRE